MDGGRADADVYAAVRQVVDGRDLGGEDAGSAMVLTIGLELVKNGAVFVVPRMIGRDSALYGGLGSALGVLVILLAVSWLLLVATAIATTTAALGVLRPGYRQEQ